MRPNNLDFPLFLLFYVMNQIFGLSEIEKLIDEQTKTCLSIEKFAQINLVTGSPNDHEELSLECFQKSLFLRIENW